MPQEIKITREKLFNRLVFYAYLVAILCSLTGCNISTGIPTSTNPTDNSTPQFASADSLSDDETSTLSSLKRVDNYPLYTMTYLGPYHWQDATTANAWWFETISQSFTGQNSSYQAGVVRSLQPWEIKKI